MRDDRENPCGRADGNRACKALGIGGCVACGLVAWTASCMPPPPAAPPGEPDGEPVTPAVYGDLQVGEMNFFEQVAREGDVIGAGFDLTVCNVGTGPVDYHANPDPRHPFFVFNVYRLSDDRIEQIGRSWVKHAFAAIGRDGCSRDCPFSLDTTRLSPNCADVYRVPTNASPHRFSPRAEINPWTGAYDFTGSTLNTDDDAFGSIDRILRLADTDLDATLHPGARFVCELVVVAHDDEERANNIAHEAIAVVQASTGDWVFDLFADDTRLGPALDAWDADLRTTVSDNDAEDGRAVLAVRVNPHPGGRWRYQYALYNRDLDRGVAGLRIPLSGAVTVEDVRFHGPPPDGDAHDDAPWEADITDTAVTWSAQSAAETSEPNALLWATMFHFEFVADQPPAPATATLTPFKAGSTASLPANTLAPAAEAMATGL